jgi:drug/metabolite transporter (DMT)-like permease
MSSYAFGIMAALAGPFTMTLGFVIWDTHWIGSAFALNLFKCNLASIAFAILSIVTRLDDRPFSPPPWDNVGYLMLSSVFGILVGDVAWLEGLRLLGVRNIIVMDSLKPFLAAVFGWAFLGEQLQWAALGGIVCTVMGILLVSLQQQQDPTTTTTNDTSTPTTITRSDQEEQGLTSIMESSQLETTQLQSTSCATAAYSMIQDVDDISKRSERTASLADSSTVSLATGTFPSYSSNDDVEVTVFVDRSSPAEITTAAASTTAATTTTSSENHHDRDQSQDVPSRNDISVPDPTSNRDSTNANKRATTSAEYYYGYGMAILNVVLDTYGSVLTKQHGTNFTTWEINLIRFGFAGIVMLVLSLTLQLRDYWYWWSSQTITTTPLPTTIDHQQQQGTSTTTTTITATTTSTTTTPWYKLPVTTMSMNAWFHVVMGVLFVTFITPALSNYALFQIALALALTLGSVGPLYALPLTFLLQKEERKRPTIQVCLGAMITVVGIVILAFWGTLE